MMRAVFDSNKQITTKAQWTGVFWDTAEIDDEDEFDSASGEFDCKRKGVYVASACLHFSGDDNQNTFSVALCLNGSGTKLSQLVVNTSTNGGICVSNGVPLNFPAMPVNLDVGDSLKIFAYEAGDNSVSMTFYAISCYFSVFRIGSGYYS